MRARHFLSMPLGTFNATDGIYSYTIEKELTGEYSETLGEFTWWLKEESHTPYNIKRIQLHVRYEQVFEQGERGYYQHINIKYPIMTGSTSVGGIGVHDNDMSGRLRSLELLPTGSFKEYVKKESPAFYTELSEL